MTPGFGGKESDHTLVAQLIIRDKAENEKTLTGDQPSGHGTNHSQWLFEAYLSKA